MEVKTFQVSTVDGAELSILEQKQLEANEWQNTNNKLIYAAGQNIPGSYICRSNGSLTFTELFELFECLPVIETLYLSLDLIDVFEDGRVPRELPTPLFHLKYLDIYNVFFTNKDELIIAFLIKNSPNLEKLKILDGAMSETSMGSSSRVECYPSIMLEHLNELEIDDFVNHKTRLDFVKLILARESDFDSEPPQDGVEYCIIDPVMNGLITKALSQTGQIQ
ncbi:hypothetical protein Tco_0945658 [Tanacetum coccineum]